MGTLLGADPFEEEFGPLPQTGQGPVPQPWQGPQPVTIGLAGTVGERVRGTDPVRLNVTGLPGAQTPVDPFEEEFGPLPQTGQGPAPQPGAQPPAAMDPRVPAIGADGNPAPRTTSSPRDWRHDRDFLGAIGGAAKRLKVRPQTLLAMIEGESDFNPRNRTGSYSGLFQLSADELKAIGVDPETYAHMSRADQVGVFVQHALRNAGYRPGDGDDQLMLVPPFGSREVRGKPDDHIVWRAGSREASANRGWLDANGNVTRGAALQFYKRRLRNYDNVQLPGKAQGWWDKDFLANDGRAPLTGAEAQNYNQHAAGVRQAEDEIRARRLELAMNEMGSNPRPRPSETIQKEIDQLELQRQTHYREMARLEGRPVAGSQETLDRTHDALYGLYGMGVEGADAGGPTAAIRDPLGQNGTVVGQADGTGLLGGSVPFDKPARSAGRDPLAGDGFDPDPEGDASRYALRHPQPWADSAASSFGDLLGSGAAWATDKLGQLFLGERPGWFTDDPANAKARERQSGWVNLAAIGIPGLNVAQGVEFGGHVLGGLATDPGQTLRGLYDGIAFWDAKDLEDGAQKALGLTLLVAGGLHLKGRFTEYQLRSEMVRRFGQYGMTPDMAARAVEMAKSELHTNRLDQQFVDTTTDALRRVAEFGDPAQAKAATRKLAGAELRAQLSPDAWREGITKADLRKLVGERADAVEAILKLREHAMNVPNRWAPPAAPEQEPIWPSERVYEGPPVGPEARTSGDGLVRPGGAGRGEPAGVREPERPYVPDSAAQAPSELDGMPKQEIVRADDPAANLRRAQKYASGDLEVATNPRLKFVGTNGHIWVLGQGKTVDDHLDEVRNMTPDEIAAARNWYEAQVPGFLERGYTERHAIADAAANQNVSTDGARGHLMKLLDQEAGLNNSGEAGLNDARVRQILAGEPYQAIGNSKLPDFIDAYTGSNTRGFVGYDETGGAPYIVDLHTATDTGGLISHVILNKLIDPKGNWRGGTLNGEPIVDTTVTRTRTDADGKTVPVEVEITTTRPSGRKRKTLVREDFQGVPTAVQYEKIAHRGRQWTDELNRRGHDGGDWLPHQQQAVGWMSILRRRGEVVQGPDFAWVRNTGTLANELNYDWAPHLGKQYPSLEALPIDAQRAMTLEVLEPTVRDLAKIIGGSLRIQSIDAGWGWWNGKRSPNVVVRATGSALTRDALRSALALVGEQGGALELRFERGTGRATAFLMQDLEGKPLPDDVIDRFFEEYKGLKGLTTKTKSGDTVDLFGSATKLENGHIVGNLTEVQATKLQDAFDEFVTHNEIDARAKMVRHEAHYDEQDWEANDQGETYQRRLRLAGGSRLVGDVLDYRATYAGHLEDAFARHAPGLLDPAGRSGRVRAVADAITPADVGDLERRVHEAKTRYEEHGLAAQAGDDAFRPEATAQQRQLADRVGRALDRRGRLSGIARAIRAEFARGQGAELLGQRVENAHDLATVANILRRPDYETLRVVFVKDGVVAGVESTSCRAPGFAASFVPREDLPGWITERMARYDADGYWLLHNHPSGVPTPSADDRALTMNHYLAEQQLVLDKELPGNALRGHVVIDHSAYGVINPYGEVSMHALPQHLRAEPWGNNTHPLLGLEALNAEAMVALAKRVQGAGVLTMISLDSQGRTRALNEAAMAEWSEMPMARLLADWRRTARGQGGAMNALVLPRGWTVDGTNVVNAEKAIDQAATERVAALRARDLIVDVVDLNGESMRRNVAGGEWADPAALQGRMDMRGNPLAREVDGKPIVKRSAEFDRFGTYDVEHNGRRGKISRDATGGGGWYVDGDGHYINRWIGYSKAEALDYIAQDGHRWLKHSAPVEGVKESTSPYQPGRRTAAITAQEFEDLAHIAADRIKGSLAEDGTLPQAKATRIIRELVKKFGIERSEAATVLRAGRRLLRMERQLAEEAPLHPRIVDLHTRGLRQGQILDQLLEDYPWMSRGRLKKVWEQALRKKGLSPWGSTPDASGAERQQAAVAAAMAEAAPKIVRMQTDDATFVEIAQMLADEHPEIPKGRYQDAFLRAVQAAGATITDSEGNPLPVVTRLNAEGTRVAMVLGGGAVTIPASVAKFLDTARHPRAARWIGDVIVNTLSGGRWPREQYMTEKRLLDHVAGEDPELHRWLIGSRENAVTAMTDELATWRDRLREEVPIALDRAASALIMQYGEGKIGKDDLPEDQADAIIAADKWFRQNYDDVLQRVNRVLRKYGKPEIMRRSNYYTHMQEGGGMVSQLMQAVRGSKGGTAGDMVGGVATTGAARTVRFNPFAQQRLGDQTVYDALNSFETWLDATLAQIYLTKPAMRHAALAAAVLEHAAMMRRDPQLAIEERLGKRDDMKGLEIFAKALTGYQRELSGQRQESDAANQDGPLGPFINAAEWLARRFGSAAIPLSIRSALMQLSPLKWGLAEYGPIELGRALMANRRDGAILDESPFLRRRYTDLRSARIEWRDVMRRGAMVPMEAIEEPVVEMLWRAEYERALAHGHDQAEAIRFADDYIERTVAGRAIGEKPLVFLTAFGRIVAQFQLEKANDLQRLLTNEYQRGPAYRRKNGGRRNRRWAMVGLLASIWVLNELYDHAFNDRPEGGDLIQMLADELRIATAKAPAGKKAAAMLGRVAGEGISMVPGGQLATALTSDRDVMGTGLTRRQFFGRTDAGTLPATVGIMNLIQDMNLGDILRYFIIPYGGNQISKTVRGIDAITGGRMHERLGKLPGPIGAMVEQFSDSHIVDESKRRPKYPVRGGDIPRALLFGPYATDAAEESTNRRVQLERTPSQQRKDARDKLKKLQPIGSWQPEPPTP